MGDLDDAEQVHVDQGPPQPLPWWYFRRRFLLEDTERDATLLEEAW